MKTHAIPHGPPLQLPGMRLRHRPGVIVKPVEGTREKVNRSLRLYAFVGLLLFVGTGVTVAIATVPWLDVGAHGFDKWDAILGLTIAATKATMVAAIFMHLNHERRLIYLLIAIGAINAGGFFIGTFWHFGNLTQDRYFYEPSEHPTGVPGSSPNYAGW